MAASANSTLANGLSRQSLPLVPLEHRALERRHDIERDALRDSKATARPVLATSPPTLYDVHTHLTSAHPDTPRSRRCHSSLCALPSWAAILCILQLDMRRHSRAWGPLHPFPIAYAIPLATCPRRGLPHSLLPPTPVPLAQRLSRALRIPCAHRDRLQPDSAFTSRRLRRSASQPGVHDHRRSQRPQRPFLLAGVPLVASALAATSSAPSHFNPASATQQKHDAQPQRRLQQLQHRLPVAYVAFAASPHAATFLVRRAHYMRQSLPIPSAPSAPIPVLRPFSPLQAPSTACATPPICTPTPLSHRRRLSYPCPHDDRLRHPKFDTTHLRTLRHYPHRRRLRNAQLRDLRKGSAAVLSARSPRTRSGKIPGSGRLQPLRTRVRAQATPSNATSADLFDTVDLESRQNAHALPRTYDPLSLFRPQQKKEKEKNNKAGLGVSTRPDQARTPTGPPGCRSKAKMRKKNLAVQARSTNDERTDASPKHTVFLPKNSPSQPDETQRKPA
ncbi:hypothetical protein B0H14DRAFT_3449823 [Mycena olivaceomarginata]|nr:hypothetical protein B0H14DRAFT_3449823 [Mycena olivaceomarginata]